MKLKGIDTYKLSLFASAILFYLLITGQYAWLTYILLAFVVIERAIIAFVLWAASRMHKQMALKLTELLQASEATGHMHDEPPFDVQL